MNMTKTRHSTRGSAALECAIGTVVLLSVSVAGFDLYRLSSAQAKTIRSAVTMAEYVSQEATPVANYLRDLGQFLYNNQLEPRLAAFVTSAVHKATADDAPTVLWARTDLFGTNAASDTGIASCGKVGPAGGNATLPTQFTMTVDEVVIVAEVCIRQGDELVYQHHILPVRDDIVPPAPA